MTHKNSFLHVLTLVGLVLSLIGPMMAMPTPAQAAPMQQAGGWTAYNDCVTTTGRHQAANVTSITYTGSGTLKDQATGNSTGTTAAFTYSGTVSSTSNGQDSNSGTDAYSAFFAYADMAGVVNGSASGWWVDLTLSGLDPAKTCTFAGSAARDGGYTTRNSTFILSGDDAATNASTTGVTVNSNLSVSFCTGYNTVNGYVARWTGIQPGSDGDFIVRFEVDSGDYAYGPAVFMLQEIAGGPTNNAPDQPVLVQPLDGATNVPTPPTLEVTATDPDSDPINVTFYGRAVGGGTSEDFTLIALPDTQMYAQSYPAIFTSQTRWIVAQKTARNIVFVVHEGDITNRNNVTQWTNADTSMDYLDVGDVAYTVVPGNHDGSMKFNTYFGESRFTDKSYYQGHYFGSGNENNYSFFSAGGIDFIVIGLQYQPSSTVLDWADALLKANSSRRGIVVSHSIIDDNNSWTYQAVYTALKDNPNLFLMLCGHMHSSDGAGQRTETGNNGNKVYILQSDYQDYSNGGNGYLRIMRFSPADNKIYVQTYSPSLPGNLTDTGNQFDLVYDMAGSAAFEIIGAASGVASGSNASVVWSGLSDNTEYEWYAMANDGTASTSSATWSFTTGSAAPTYDLTMAVVPARGGTTNPAVGVHTYPEGASVAITATANSRYEFDYWEGDVDDPNDASTTVTMNGDKAVTAHFEGEELLYYFPIIFKNFKQ